jgi:CRP-like cAMP-binding protein
MFDTEQTRSNEPARLPAPSSIRERTPGAPFPDKGNNLVSARDPKRNHLLAALPEESYLRLRPDLELVAMPLGWVLYESGGRLGYLYLPISGIVSLLYVTTSGASSEIAITGKEGLVGISLFMGGESTTNRAVVQCAGHAYRMNVDVLRREFALGGGFQYLALRYTQTLITQMAQTSVCNRHHTLDQQLCRWLLLSIDRLSGSELIMTQELIANMLGVRREGVTEAAGKLQTAGLISYSRGRITVLDRPGLERRVCECYAVVKNEFKRLLPYTIPASVNRRKSPERMPCKPSFSAPPAPHPLRSKSQN